MNTDAAFHPENQYLDLLSDILANGEFMNSRSGDVLSLFGRQMRFDLSTSFPMLTTKKLPFRVIAEELLWFLRGEGSAESLEKAGVEIWREWGNPITRDLGPIYGVQWRSWPIGCGRHIDQIANLIQGLRREPFSRRHILTAWNVAEISDMALPPCHVIAQFKVHRGRLSCHLFQRSADAFLGLPFNIASYALLTRMLGVATNIAPGELIISIGDAHLYTDHREQAREQITRDPRPFPTLTLNPLRKSLDGWTAAEMIIRGYEPHDHIPAPVHP